MHAFYILYAWNYLHSGHPVMIDLFSILNTEKQKYLFHKSCTNIGVRLKVLPPNATHKILDKHWHTAFKNKLWCPINNEGFFFFLLLSHEISHSDGFLGNMQDILHIYSLNEFSMIAENKVFWSLEFSSARLV